MAALDPLIGVAMSYYYGNCGRSEADAILKSQPDGSFILRDSSQLGSFVVSVKLNEKIYHLLVVRRGLGLGMEPGAWIDNPSSGLAVDSFENVNLLIARLKQLKLVGKPLLKADDQLPPTACYSIDALAAKGQQEIARVLSPAPRPIIAPDLKATPAPRPSSALAHLEKEGFTPPPPRAGGLASLTAGTAAANTASGSSSGDKEPGAASPLSADHICTICLDAPRQAVFTSCGHFCACLPCGRLLEGSPCPLCRVPIAGVLRLFM